MIIKIAKNFTARDVYAKGGAVRHCAAACAQFATGAKFTAKFAAARFAAKFAAAILLASAANAYAKGQILIKPIAVFDKYEFRSYAGVQVKSAAAGAISELVFNGGACAALERADAYAIGPNGLKIATDCEQVRTLRFRAEGGLYLWQAP